MKYYLKLRLWLACNAFANLVEEEMAADRVWGEYQAKMWTRQRLAKEAIDRLRVRLLDINLPAIIE